MGEDDINLDFFDNCPHSRITMKPIASIHRKLVEEKAPRFAQALQKALLASSEQRVPVVTSLEDFPDQDMSLVYACLWYAQTEGIEVHFEPKADC